MHSGWIIEGVRFQHDNGKIFEHLVQKKKALSTANILCTVVYMNVIETARTLHRPCNPVSVNDFCRLVSSVSFKGIALPFQIVPAIDMPTVYNLECRRRRRRRI